MKRLNITVPEELYKELENIPNKSSLIAEALKEKMERERKRKLNSWSKGCLFAGWLMYKI